MKNIAQYITRISLALGSFLIPFAMKAQDESVAKSGEHFGIPDGTLIIILVSMAVLLSVIILIINSSIRNIAETKGFWEGKQVNKTPLLIAAFSLAGYSANAATEKASSIFVLDDASFWGLVMVNFVLICIVLYQVYLLRKLTDHVRGYKEVEPAFIQNEPSWFENIMAKMQASVPIEHEADVMMDHEYDGIHELDNVLPPWWKYGFYLTIVVAIIYMTHYHILGTGDLQIAEYEKANEIAQIELDAYNEKMASKVNEKTMVFENNVSYLENGKQVFDANCVTCHAADGGGINGPNFTDQYWIYDGDAKGIFKTIKYGAKRGMQAWQSKLTPVQMRDVAYYIYSLEGTTPLNPKAPEGELFVREGATPSTDEVAPAEETAPAGENVPAEDTVQL